MHAFFDSPDTIRNKVKEFKTATLGGLNKQDVMNYLSLLSEQQGVMIRLLRENNIPLFVDDGYEQEEQFMKPMSDGQDGLNLNQYLGGDNSVDIAELLAEIEALKAENNELKLASYNVADAPSTSTKDEPLSDFDAQYGINNSADEEKAALLKSIEEKDLYIKELENALENPSSISTEFTPLEDNNMGLTDVERQAYEEEIINLRNELDSLRNDSPSDTNIFDTEVVTLDEDVRDSYEREIESLKAQLEEALSQNSEPVNDFDSSIDLNQNENVDELKSTIESLNTTVSELQSELDVCHELLKEAENSSVKVTEESAPINLVEGTDNSDELEYLKDTIEILELEISKKDREKANIEIQLDEVNKKLSQFTSFEDENGEVVSLDPTELAIKHKEILELQSMVQLEKEEIETKLLALKEKEELIESNKHLVSEDFVNNITKKEQEIESLRKQMDKMLVVAQATADATENEAKDKAAKLVEEATEKAQEIVATATSQKDEMLNEATDTLNSAKEFKATTEEELSRFREETRQNAEEMILEAQNKANEVIEAAHMEAQKSQEEALQEVDAIMSEAEQKVAEIDAIIQAKQKEIDNMQTYYLKVKNDGLVGVKKLYNQLENIIYSDELS